MTAMLVRPRWIGIGARPVSGGVLLRLAPGVYIVRSRSWVSSTELDTLRELPSPERPERPELVRRRFPHPAWHLRAACRTVDQALFFGDEIEIAAPRRRPVLARALAWCRPCAVRVVCLAHALLTPEDSGIWGGVSARDRAGLVEGLALGVQPAAMIAVVADVTRGEAELALAEAVGARR